MKKLFTLFLVLISASITLYGAGEVDTVKVGPGVTYYSEYRSEGPWQFDILEVDLTNEYIKLQSVKADDELYGFERTSSMAKRNSYEGHRVVGAVNGDFYNTSNGEPISSQIINGEFLKTPNDRYNVGFNINNVPMIDVINFHGTLVSPDSAATVHGVNKDRGTDELVIFNHFYHNSTGTNQWGKDLIATPITDWIVNDTVKLVADTLISGEANLTIPSGKVILSGHGVSAAFLEEKIEKGDTLKLALKVSPAPDSLTQMVGGYPLIVQNGTTIGANGDRHPRTCIGYNQDKTKLYMITVDGRQAGYSIGMTLRELGDYMREWGVYRGLNLDGGGSTTMYVRGEIKNSPSDGNERSVSNSLLVVSTAPTSDLAHLRIAPGEVYAVGGSEVNFKVNGFDEFYNPLDISGETVTWTCDANIGTIDAEGVLTASEDTVSGYVYAEIGDIKDTALVRITGIASIEVTPDPVILQMGQFQQMQATALDNYGNEIELSRTDFDWSVTGGVGEISETGYFTVTNEGNGEIIAKYKEVEGKASVSIGVSQYVLIDDFTTTDEFSISGSKVNIDQCSFAPDHSVFVSSPYSGKLTYSLTTGGTSALYLNCSIPISGTPDAIGINVYGDGNGHWLRGEFEDKDGEKFLLNFTGGDPGIDWNGSWEYIEIPFSEAVASWANPTAVLDFPVTWTRIYMAETSDDKKGDGAIYLDDFQVHFIAVNSVEENDVEIPGKYELGQNYPNPFNPETTIEYSIPEENHVTIRVYDILGRVVQTLVNEEKSAGSYKVRLNGAELSSGVYFYSINAGDFHSVKKLTLLK